jgi:hypothetical protein
MTILREHRRQMDLVAGELLERETLDWKSFKHLLLQEEPQSGAETRLGAIASAVDTRLPAWQRTDNGHRIKQNRIGETLWQFNSPKRMAAR